MLENRWITTYGICERLANREGLSTSLTLPGANSTWNVQSELCGPSLLFVQHNSTIQRIHPAGSACPITLPFLSPHRSVIPAGSTAAFKLPLAKQTSEPLQEGNNKDLQKEPPFPLPSVPSCRAAISSPVKRRKVWLHCKDSASLTLIYHRQWWCGESPGCTGGGWKPSCHACPVPLPILEMCWGCLCFPRVMAAGWLLSPCSTSLTTCFRAWKVTIPTAGLAPASRGKQNQLSPSSETN